MKTKLIAIAVAFSAFAIQAQAAGLNDVTQGARYAISNIQTGQVNQLLPGNRVSGRLTLDAATRTLDVYFVSGFFCPPGSMCPMMMPAPVQATLPVSSVQIDRCGTIIITAKEDKRPVDGALKMITVRDYSRTTCRIYKRFKMEATYRVQFTNRSTGQNTTSDAYLYGTEFAPSNLK